MFVTTANTLNILPPLLDRMEVIRLSGYTEDEKVNISQKYLIPNQSKNNGLKKEEWTIDENINRKIIRHLYERVWCKKFRERDFKNCKKAS